MATCEMCGDNGDLKKTKVEGTTLKLCEDCQEVGEVQETGTSNANPRSRSRSTSSSRSSSSSRSRSRRNEPDEELAADYGQRVKQAREQRGLSVGELAGNLKEKDSVVRRIESGKLAPNQKLARKVENALDINLYESVSSNVQADTESSDASSGQTIGDVADVKEG